MALTIVLLLAMASPAQPAATHPRASAQPDATARQKAEVLTALTHPASTLVALNMKGWETAARGSLGAFPQSQAIEKAYPGALNAAVAAARPLALDYVKRSADQARARRVGMLAQRLTAAELDEATRFFRGAGGRLMAGIWQSVNLDVVADEAVKSAVEGEDVAIKASTMGKVGRAAARKSLGQMSAADNLVVMRFEVSAVGRKYLALQPELEALDLEQANKPDPAWLKRQHEAMRAALIAFSEGQRPAGSTK